MATAAWLDGQSVGDGLRSRAAQAWNSLGRTRGVPVLATVEIRLPQAGPPARGRALLEAVLAVQEERDGLAIQATGLSWRR